MFKAVIFDWDGTLAGAKKEIINTLLSEKRIKKYFNLVVTAEEVF